MHEMLLHGGRFIHFEHAIGLNLMAAFLCAILVAMELDIELRGNAA